MKISLPALQHPGTGYDGRLHVYFQRKKDLGLNTFMDEKNRRLNDANTLVMEVKGEQRAIFNKTYENVETAMKYVDSELEARRGRLRKLLEKEQNEQALELLARMERITQAEIDKKKPKVLQLEQTPNKQDGSVCLDYDNKLLGLRQMSGQRSMKELQKIHILQMHERQNIQRQECDRERMWHQIMLEQHQQIDKRKNEEKLAFQQIKEATKIILKKQMTDAETIRRFEENRVKGELNRRFEAINETVTAENRCALQRKLIARAQWNEYFQRERTAKGLASEAAKVPHPLDLARIENANRDLQNHEQWLVAKKHRTAFQETIFLQHQTEERLRQKQMEEDAENFAQQCLREKQLKCDQENRLYMEYKAKMKQKSIAILKQQLSDREQAFRLSQLARFSAAEETRRSAQRSRQEEYDKKLENIIQKMDYAKELEKQMKLDYNIRVREQQLEAKRHMEIQKDKNTKLPRSIVLDR